MTAQPDLLTVSAMATAQDLAEVTADRISKDRARALQLSPGGPSSLLAMLLFRTGRVRGVALPCM